ncbi:MAG: arylformamidase [Pyrinomonadaceae bacterium]|nr:arylformamidase [Pyrinomonadaceae bacterium]
MPIYDISVAISPDTTPTYPGDPTIEIVSWAAMARGDAANVTFLHMGAHTATHVDAPAHFIEHAPQVSALPLEVLIGEARVVELGDEVREIDAGCVAAHVAAGTTRVLFKSRNSNFWHDDGKTFREDFTHLTPDGARSLNERGVRLVGIDYLSVEKFKSETFETHTTLLSAGVVVVEGLDLRGVAAGVYELICLPLKIAAGSGDGAPARAVLRTYD